MMQQIGSNESGSEAEERKEGSVKTLRFKALCGLLSVTVALAVFCLAAIEKGGLGRHLRSSRSHPSHDDGDVTVATPELEFGVTRVGRNLATATAATCASPGDDDNEDPDYFFIHVPPLPNPPARPNTAKVKAGLADIVAELTKEWQAEHGVDKKPKICYAGFAGKWSPNSKPKPNNAGIIADDLGGEVMEISYCSVHKTLSELWESGECDIIIAMGEGRDEFTLERQGDDDQGITHTNCNADLPTNAFPGSYVCPITGDPLEQCDQYVVPPVCKRTGECQGTSFNEKSCRDATKDKATKIVEEMGGKTGNGIPVKAGTDTSAGNFCCGFASCWRDWCEAYPPPDTTEPTGGTKPTGGSTKETEPAQQTTEPTGSTKQTEPTQRTEPTEMSSPMESIFD